MPKVAPPCPLTPPLPANPDQPLRWSRLYGSARGLALVSAARQHPGPLLVVAGDARTAQQLEDELRFYLGADIEQIPLLGFPDWECLPYDSFSPHPDLISQRLDTLYRLPGLGKGIVVTQISSLLHRLSPRQYVLGQRFELRRGQRLELDRFRLRLSEAAYEAVGQVIAPGEYAIRGGLLDLFPMGAAQPYRIDLFGDEIESIRLFDPETQRSGQALDQVHLLPAREYPMTEEATRRFRQAFRAQFEGDPQKTRIYRDVSQHISPAGIEYYLPLFFEQPDTLFDYLPDKTLIAATQDVRQAAGRFQAEVVERYRERRLDPERPPLPPERLFLEPDRALAELQHYPLVEILSFRADENPASASDTLLPEAPVASFTTEVPPSLPVDHRAEHPWAALLAALRDRHKRILLVAETPGRRESLKEMLSQHQMHPDTAPDWTTFLASDAPLMLATAPLERGLELADPAVRIITETQLHGERAVQRRRRSSQAREPESIIRSLAELKPGDPVVHEDHGVGRYLGLQMLDVGDGPTEFLALEYARQDKLYIPVTSLHLISRYTGADADHAPLHHLGGDAWEIARQKAQKKAHDAAAELLEIYARRAARKGRAFATHTPGYQALVESFPFEETPDQEKAIEDVLADMASEKPMDRLVCGDVGFGKTEVAVRATYVAAEAGTQVAVLVPTTLLAQQHFQNFRDRLADLPVRVELISRFRSKKEQGQVLAQLANGKVDIIVGTHRLLQEDIKFRNLGLVVIDEEHRFGVRQKERLKKLRSEVDVLTLTATPIPRTLNMGLAGLRDISIIATAPAERLSVKTFVYEYNSGIVREACLREIRRGGQVYYLHNEVRTMEKVLRDLQALLPEADVRMAHGQMPERELEQIMLDFYHQRFSILLCSTIIESGIDVPTANTILIDRADKFGLAQLHQLRGRVGRSHHRAYAYLFIPSRKFITPDASKRLDAIAALDDLGAGFALASHDLEIRGAGELLGESQSGEIDQVGFAMYSELLQRAIKSIREGKELSLETGAHSGTEINIHAPALLPESYIMDVHTRLVLYKRIASAATSDTLTELKEEIVDRFGPLPAPAVQLFQVTALKISATPLGIRKVDAGPKGVRLEFEAAPNIDPVVIIQMMQAEPDKYRLDGKDKLRIMQSAPEPGDRVRVLEQLFRRLKQGG